MTVAMSYLVQVVSISSERFSELSTVLSCSYLYFYILKHQLAGLEGF